MYWRDCRCCCSATCAFALPQRRQGVEDDTVPAAATQHKAVVSKSPAVVVLGLVIRVVVITCVVVGVVVVIGVEEV